MPARKLNILFVSAEVAPLAKVGGLADVAGSLPKALKALGHDVRIAMPDYRMIEDNPNCTVEDELPWFEVPIRPGLTQRARVRRTTIDGGVPVYLVGHPRYFREATESRKVYTLEPRPYVFFDRAVCEFVPRLSPAWTPDVVHCNDWHTGLVPVYLELYYRRTAAWSQASRVFTVHNMAFQGDFPRPLLDEAGIPGSEFTFDRLEFYGRMSFMKGGLVYSDLVNTVSRTYAEEVQTPEYGCGLDGLLRHLASLGRLSGIVNGIDYDEYNPATDPMIPVNYTAADPRGKTKCKSALQAECGLPRSRGAAVIGLVSRLSDQKGLDLISAAAESLLALPIQLVVLGTGEPRYERSFADLAGKHRKKAHVAIRFDAALAQRIYAGSDMFLMPSRFEPCGLGQLLALRYGTIPIVRATGGLADTIVDVDALSRRGTGFVFTPYDANALLATVRRAVETFGDAEQWRAVVSRAMAADFSWSGPAREYVRMYRRSLTKGRLAKAA